jgi:hypothetical protein
MKVTAFCNNSCCPEISFEPKDPSQPILITDDYQGSIPLTLKDFDNLSKHIADIKKTNVFPVVVSDREFFIHSYETDKPYISIRMVDGTGNTREVKDITFDHWEIFTEAIAKHYGAITA